MIATCSQASAQSFEFIDGNSGASLFEISYSALPGTATNVNSFGFTPAGSTFFGITGSEDYQSVVGSLSLIHI